MRLWDETVDCGGITIIRTQWGRYSFTIAFSIYLFSSKPLLRPNAWSIPVTQKIHRFDFARLTFRYHHPYVAR
jgi:hypothetical protein